MRRVVITGMGLVTPIGNTLEQFFDSLLACRSGVRPVTLFDAARLSAPVAAECDFVAEKHFSSRKIDLYDRFALLAIEAARRSLADSGIEPTDADRSRWGVNLGSAYGGAASYNASYRRLYAEGKDHVHPLTIPRLMHNASTSAVSMELGLQGPSLLFSTACSSAAHAIGEAMMMIRHGRADRMLAGGSDAPVTFPVMRSWEAMRVLATPDPNGNGDVSRLCRPFSADRTGLVLGEGAAILLLEEYGLARQRGARMYAELAGYGASSDAAHITNPSVDGATRAIEAALADAGLRVEDVDYVNAHGTGTRINDSTETQALKKAFGDAALDIPVSSTKALHGHLMGASGAVELVAVILAAKNGMLPPTAHYTAPDAECDLDFVPNTPRPGRIRAALSNSFAFGGLNAVLAIKNI